MTLALDRLIVALCLLGLLAVTGHALASTAAILNGGLPDEDPALAEVLAKQIRAAGYQVIDLDATALCDPERLSAKTIDLLVLPNSASLPAKSTETVQAYVKAGGDIIALNAPMWQRALLNLGGQWLTREEYQARNAGTPPDHVLFDFKAGGIANWRRASNSMEVQTVTETVTEGPAAGQGALHVTIPSLISWDTLGVSDLSNPFPNGNTLTVFSAKGDERTNQLSIEWDEKDGSRWIAVVALTPEWRQYVLTPDDFKYWISVPGRGGRGDRFHPENAVGMAVGLAHTHTTAVGTGRFEYWVGPFGTAKMTPEFRELLSATDPPALDTLSPSYKLFDSQGVAKLQVRTDQAIVDEGGIPLPKTIRSPHPRPRGAGYSKGREWRWIPLVEARTAKGEWRGTPVTLTANASGPYAGSMWASFGIGDADWYKSSAALRIIRQIAAKMRDGVFLVDGGTNYFTYFTDQQVKRGVRVANLSTESRTGITMRVNVEAGNKRKGFRSHVQWSVPLATGELREFDDTWVPDYWPLDGIRVVAQLEQDGKVTDKVSHDIHVWQPKKQKVFVTIEDGEFRLNGKIWRPVGVNYMPSSGIGTEDGQYFEHYLSARSYDPEVFQRDIEHIKDLGYNAVSIFIYTGHEKAQNLNDLLRRLDKLGIKANVSLRPGTPMEFLWPQIGDIIKNARLMDNDTVFAYDLAWEPSFGHQRDRVIWDGEWQKWIIERYGSVENAERDWEFKIPRDEQGKITNPLPEHIDETGPWNRMSAAYRRFLDTLLYKKYGAARRLVRSLDPNHYVSFRMSEATNPTYRWEGRITYDFPYLAAAVDFLAPEAYGRIGEWDSVKPGWFQRAYARWAAPMKPMIWAEQGCSVWDMSRMCDSPARLEFQAKHYEAFYRMLMGSGADGIFSWWYPGGFRYGENSDFGIINPDGTDRAVTTVIRKAAPRFISTPSAKPVNAWITIDRDEHPQGITGIYEKAGAQFWRAIDSGRTPGLRTQGTGTTSANCPLLAVGNTPCNGKNPPKYLDAAIDVVEIKGADGNWVPVEKDGSVKVKAGEPVVARVELTNLGEARLHSPNDGKLLGAVYLIAQGSKGQLKTALPSSVDHLASATAESVTLTSEAVTQPTEVTITFEAEGRTPFGEKFRLTLLP